MEILPPQVKKARHSLVKACNLLFKNKIFTYFTYAVLSEENTLSFIETDKNFPQSHSFFQTTVRDHIIQLFKEEDVLESSCTGVEVKCSTSACTPPSSGSTSVKSLLHFYRVRNDQLEVWTFGSPLTDKVFTKICFAYTQFLKIFIFNISSRLNTFKKNKQLMVLRLCEPEEHYSLRQQQLKNIPYEETYRSVIQDNILGNQERIKLALKEITNYLGPTQKEEASFTKQVWGNIPGKRVKFLKQALVEDKSLTLGTTCLQKKQIHEQLLSYLHDQKIRRFIASDIMAMIILENDHTFVKEKEALNDLLTSLNHCAIQEFFTSYTKGVLNFSSSYHTLNQLLQFCMQEEVYTAYLEYSFIKKELQDICHQGLILALSKMYHQVFCFWRTSSRNPLEAKLVCTINTNLNAQKTHILLDTIPYKLELKEECALKNNSVH